MVGHNQRPAKAELMRQTAHEGQAPRAAFELAQLYEEHGDIEGAREAYRIVLEAGGHGLAGPAVCGLRRLK